MQSAFNHSATTSYSRYAVRTKTELRISATHTTTPDYYTIAEMRKEFVALDGALRQQITVRTQIDSFIKWCGGGICIRTWCHDKTHF